MGIKCIESKVLKIFMLTMSLTLVVLLLACFATGCDRNLKVYQDGYFQYIIVEENGGQPDKNNKEVVAVVGFTSSGMQQEVIDFPEEIDGKPLLYIGYRNPSTAANSYYHLESDKLKKVYIHENIKTVCREAFVYFSENNIDLDFMVCQAKSPYEIFAETYFGKYYIYKSVYESNAFDENIYGANIVFMNNYSTAINEGYHSLDNIKSGEKINIPKSPVRSGYEFTGWYAEPQCINAWDFNISPTIEEGAELRLYAGWRAL
jgi:uncharacterized repeat protein (TIGR02543 family)